jgi:heme exporter protein C
VPLLVAGTYLALTWVPPLDEGFVAPVAQRIFYFHLGAALASYAAVAVAAAASALYLRRGRMVYDTLARDSAGLALVFALTVLIEGSLWATAEWGTAWRWEDARLDSYLILTLVFAGYLALRRAVEEPERRARVGAAYALLGSVLVPISFASVYLWQSLHPRVLVPGGQGISAQGGMTVGIFVVAFMLLFVGLLLKRTEVSALEARIDSLQRGVEA